jgi:hypothetical protein
MVDKLIQGLKASFSKITEHRYKNAQKPLADYLQSAFAMFHLKDPSLHHYRINYGERQANLSRIYQIQSLPSDSALREGIDGIAPKDLQACFKYPLQVLEDEGVMNKYKVLGRYTTFLFDGTEHYCNKSSSDAPCPYCLSKEHNNKKGEVTSITYHHQALGCVLAHPDHKEVFPLCAEPIIRQDGTTKNDCEQNAAKRLIPIIENLLPQKRYDLLGVFDGLYPNSPFIRLLQKHQIRFIIGIKDGYVPIQVEKLRAQNALEHHEWVNEKGDKCCARWCNKLIFNGQNQDMLVNYFEYQQYDVNGKRIYSNAWITNLPIVKKDIQELVKVGRSRWKIENETFNTLKNQGYHLEHSYGHGTKYLTTNFMILTFLAFLVDQITQKLDSAFQKSHKYCKTKKNLWEKIRQIFDLIPCMSMNVIYRIIVKDAKIDFPLMI